MSLLKFFNNNNSYYFVEGCPVPDPAHVILLNPPNNPFETISIIISIIWMKAEAVRMCPKSHTNKWLDRDILPSELVI